jgi:hypothetical protein
VTRTLARDRRERPDLQDHLQERQDLRGRRDRRDREQGPARQDLEAAAGIAPNPRMAVLSSKQLPTLTPTISCLFSSWLGSLLRRLGGKHAMISLLTTSGFSLECAADRDVTMM